MTNNEILRDAVTLYDESTVRGQTDGMRDGTICDPGRMEDETLLTLYLSELDGNGCGGEVLSDMDDGVGEYTYLLDLDAEDRAELAAVGFDLDPDTVAALYTVSDSGFESSQELTAEERDAVVAAYGSAVED